MAMNIKGKNPTPVESEEETLPPLLVATIKLGTKSCGFAYQLKYEFEENPENVRSFIFKTGTTIRIDFPPALKLTGEGRAEEFGYEAIKQFEEMEGYSEDYVFFENVIESLYISEFKRSSSPMSEDVPNDERDESLYSENEILISLFNSKHESHHKNNKVEFDSISTS